MLVLVVCVVYWVGLFEVRPVQNIGGCCVVSSMCVTVELLGRRQLALLASTRNWRVL